MGAVIAFFIFAGYLSVISIAELLLDKFHSR